MNNIQKQIIIGSLLGDGSLSGSKTRPNWNWRFVKTQSKLDISGTDKISYVEYHYNNFKYYISRIVHYNRGKFFGYSIRTKYRKEFTELGKQWYQFKLNTLVKVVPKNIELLPMSLCIWYMDDGTKDKEVNRIRIATNCFQDNEVEFLVNLINKNFALNGKLIHNCNNQPMIEIGGYNNYKTFYDVIIPFVRWDCFKYKIESPKNVVYLSGERHPLSKLNNSEILSILELYKCGKTQTEIANIFNVRPNTISTILNGKSRQTKNISDGVKGEKNPRAKLSLSDVKQIRNSSDKAKFISYKFGISLSTISRIRNNKGWL